MRKLQRDDEPVTPNNISVISVREEKKSFLKLEKPTLFPNPDEKVKAQGSPKKAQGSPKKLPTVHETKEYNVLEKDELFDFKL